jgi:hypothetical protein
MPDTLVIQLEIDLLGPAKYIPLKSIHPHIRVTSCEPALNSFRVLLVAGNAPGKLISPSLDTYPAYISSGQATTVYGTWTLPVNDN